MRRKSRFMKLASMLSVSVLVVGMIISCGSNSSDNGAPAVTYSSATEAADGGSSAKASVDLTNAISDAASGLSSSSNPAGYAPGKGGATTTDTSSIASLDPKLQGLVDGMLGTMKTTAVKNAVSKARSSKAGAQIAAAPGTPVAVIVSGPCTSGNGSFRVTGTDTSAVGYKEYTVDIDFYACQDAAAPDYSITTGTIHVYDKEADNLTNTRSATVKLMANKYVAGVLAKIDVVDATFTGNDSGTLLSRIGTNTSNGSFSETDIGKQETGTFYFTNMSSSWTWDDDGAGVKTASDKVSGNFGLKFDPAVGQSLTLNIGLSNLQNKLRSNVDNSIDQWVNGSVTITWTPDLSARGCKSGRVTFTTAELTPLHYSNSLDTCPDSGTLVVNNATIVYYGPDDLTHIVITVGTDTISLLNCTTMEGGICSN